MDSELITQIGVPGIIALILVKSMIERKSGYRKTNIDGLENLVTRDELQKATVDHVDRGECDRTHDAIQRDIKIAGENRSKLFDNIGKMKEDLVMIKTDQKHIIKKLDKILNGNQ